MGKSGEFRQAFHWLGVWCRTVFLTWGNFYIRKGREDFLDGGPGPGELVQMKKEAGQEMASFYNTENNGLLNIFYHVFDKKIIKELSVFSVIKVYLVLFLFSVW